ncbi:MAG TPA: NADH-quinone oxidoreductase subunit E, partial [Mycobacterium sp.]
ALRAGEPPKPTRGASLCTFRDTARILAGLPIAEDAADGTPAGAATLAGLRFAREHGMTAPSPDSQPSDTTGPQPGHEQAEAAEAVRDEPAPGPSASLPAQSATPETDPKAADSQ